MATMAEPMLFGFPVRLLPQATKIRMLKQMAALSMPLHVEEYADSENAEGQAGGDLAEDVEEDQEVQQEPEDNEMEHREDADGGTMIGVLPEEEQAVTQEQGDIDTHAEEVRAATISGGIPAEAKNEQPEQQEDTESAHGPGVQQLPSLLTGRGGSRGLQDPGKFLLSLLKGPDPPAPSLGNGLVSGTQTAGRVKYYNDRRGFGFIRIPGGSQDVYFQRRDIDAASQNLLTWVGGQGLTGYTANLRLEALSDGRWQARSITLSEDQYPAQYHDRYYDLGYCSDAYYHGKGGRRKGWKAYADEASGSYATNGKGMRQPQQDRSDRSQCKKQCQFIIGIEEDPIFRVGRRLLGPRGSHAKAIAAKTGCRLRLRGKGSWFLEGPNREESSDPLMLCVSSPSERHHAKAVQLIEELLLSVYADFREFCVKEGWPVQDLQIRRSAAC